MMSIAAATWWGSMECRTMSGRAARALVRGDCLAACSHANLSVHPESGFTYVGALILVVVTGIALTAASTYWSTKVRREKEAELLFRGDQICSAIESYYEKAPPGWAKSYPSRLEDLLKDPRYMKVMRHLRRVYKDPMTEDGQWGLVMDGKGGIKGVFSRGKNEPIKIGDFPEGYENFEKAKTYQDWKFVYEPAAKAPAKKKIEER